MELFLHALFLFLSLLLITSKCKLAGKNAKGNIDLEKNGKNERKITKKWGTQSKRNQDNKIHVFFRSVTKYDDKNHIFHSNMFLLANENFIRNLCAFLYTCKVLPCFSYAIRSNP